MFVRRGSRKGVFKTKFLAGMDANGFFFPLWYRWKKNRSLQIISYEQILSPPPHTRLWPQSVVGRCVQLNVKWRLQSTLRQTNVILQYKLLALMLSAVCSVIQQSEYVLHFYYTIYDGKYDCKITMHQTIFQLQCFVLLNNHQYNCNIKKSFLSVLITLKCHP